VGDPPFKLCLLDIFACAFEARKPTPGAAAPAAIAGTENGPCHHPRHRSVPHRCLQRRSPTRRRGHGLVREGHACRQRQSTSALSCFPALPRALSQRGMVSGRDFIAAWKSSAMRRVARLRPRDRHAGFCAVPPANRIHPDRSRRGPRAGSPIARPSKRMPATSAIGALGRQHDIRPQSMGRTKVTEDMFFHPGFAARSGRHPAVLLAELGAEGSEGALDGPAGLPDRLFSAARSFPMSRCSAVRLNCSRSTNKPVPACNFSPRRHVRQRSHWSRDHGIKGRPTSGRSVFAALLRSGEISGV